MNTCFHSKKIPSLCQLTIFITSIGYNKRRDYFGMLCITLTTVDEKTILLGSELGIKFCCRGLQNLRWHVYCSSQQWAIQVLKVNGNSPLLLSRNGCDQMLHFAPWHLGLILTWHLGLMTSGPITSWQIDGKIMETVRDFIFGGSKVTADGDCSHEIKQCLPLGRKAMTNLDSILKSSDVTLPTKVPLVKAMVFPVVMYGYES